MSFLKSAVNRRVDVREFLKKAANGDSIKYKGGKGEKHQLYITYSMVEQEDDNGNKVQVKKINAIMGNMHEIRELGSKYPTMTLCVDGEFNKDAEGNVVNDGTCPLCDYVGKSWDIYNYRKNLEESTCGKTGQLLDEHMKQMGEVFRKERKVTEAKPYMYLLVAQFRTDAAKQYAPVIGANGLPEYELKVMRMSKNTVEKLQQQLENSGVELEGTEIIIGYPNDDNILQMYLNRTVSIAFNKRAITEQYPAVVQAINDDVSKFDWEGIESAFPEWKGMANEVAKSKCDKMFEAWDAYQAELATNPNAKYLEYVGIKQTGANPSLEGTSAAPQLPQFGGMMGGQPQQMGGAEVQMPGQVTAQPAQQPFGATGGFNGIPDANAIFGNMGGTPNGGIKL